MEEIWKPVVGYETIYEVSNLGRIRSLGRVLAGSNTNDVYGRVKLFQHGKGQRHSTHSVVAAAFIGPRPTGKEINHKDGNTHNNMVENLEYCTRSENIKHSIIVLGNPLPPSGERHNSKTNPDTFPRGSSHGNAKLSEKDVLAIRKSYEQGEVSQPTLAKRYGVSLKVIWQVIHRVTWKHI